MMNPAAIKKAAAFKPVAKNVTRPMAKAAGSLAGAAKKYAPTTPKKALRVLTGGFSGLFGGGIKRSKMTNPVTGVTAKVRGNFNKQRPIPGFNRPWARGTVSPTLGRRMTLIERNAPMRGLKIMQYGGR